MEKNTEKKCFVCKNIVPSFDNDSAKNRKHQIGECKRFYSLVCRYLNINLDGTVINSSASHPNRTLKRNETMFCEETISCCDICVPLIESFTDTYNNWKILQLVLNWKLETITKLMLIKSKFEDGDFSKSELFRKRFLALVKDKSRDFPRLVIPKIEDLPATQRVNIDKTRQRSEPEPTEISDFENDDIEDFRLQDNAYQEQEVEPNIKCLTSRITKVKRNCKSVGICHADNKTTEHEAIQKKKPKPNKCRICGKTFANNWNRRRHEKSHSPKSKTTATSTTRTNYKCQICSKEFKVKRNLIKHKRIHRDSQTNSVKYKSRNARRPHKSHSDREKNTATTQSTYKCQVCSKEFKNKYNFKTHQQLHNGEQLYSCCVCQKKFALVHSWKRHERNHKKGPMWHDTRKRDQTNWPFKCAFCPKKFDDEYKHVMHERFHKGIMPYSCRYCGKKYCRFDSKKRHERENHKPGEMSHAEKNKISKSVKQEIEKERNVDDGKSNINLEQIQVCIIKSEQDATECHRDDAMFLD